MAKSSKTQVEREGAGAASYDGAWIFEATTASGDCPSLAPSSVTIQGGRVVSANNGAMTPWGYVEGDGTFVARFTDQNGRISRASGTLRGASGSGAWSSSTNLCGGAWRASRASERAEQ